MTENKAERSLNVFDLIDSICADFREQWKSNSEPRIGDFLDRVPEEASDTLFRNLLLADRRFREHRRHPLTSQEYIRRYPGFRRIVNEVFIESASISLGQNIQTITTDSEGLAATTELPEATRLGDYELLGILGRGAFGIVYRASHIERGDQVALKTLPTGLVGQTSPLADAEKLHNFRREFRMLAEVNHPNLVGMQSLEVAGGQWFFTMDLVVGVSFMNYVRPDDELSLERLRATLPQLVNGILALHGRQVLHRDLKPSNVLVDNQGVVRILDFGLLAELGHQLDKTVSFQGEGFVGTAGYSAPEQTFGKFSAASDWYAVGVLVFEALTGQRPFEGSVSDVLFEKNQRAAPVLSERSDLPSDLTALTDALLERMPEDRPTPLQIARLLSVEVSEAEIESRELAGSRNKILVGRDSHQAALEQVLGQLRLRSTPQVVFVTGRSGEGKTSLAEAFLEPYRNGDDHLVLSGRCYDRESVPFKALDGVIDALVDFLRSPKGQSLVGSLPADTRCLAEVFPAIRRVDAFHDLRPNEMSQIGGKQLRHRAFGALREILCKIAGKLQVILFVDDLQWGDSESARVLIELMGEGDPPAILFLGSHRSDEKDVGAFLSHWNDSARDVLGRCIHPSVRVGPLNEEQCVQLVILRVGKDSELIREKAKELFESTEGNPYFLEQLVECFDPVAGSFQPLPLVDVISARLNRLPENAERLLECIAVSGQAISIAELTKSTDEAGSGFQTLIHMRSERLVKLVGHQDRQVVDTYHDKIRETVLEAMSTERRGDLHQCIGQTIESLENIRFENILELEDDIDPTQPGTVPAMPRVFDLAYHFDRSVDSRAFAYHLLAGEEALRAFTAKIALQHLERAEELFPKDASNELKHRLIAALALTHSTARNPTKAIEYSRLAFDLATTPLAKATAKFGEARILTYSGRLDDARRRFDEAFDVLGAPRPSTVVGRLFGAFGSTLRILFVRNSRLRRRGVAESERARFEHDLYLRLGSFSWEQDASQWIHCAMRQADLAVRSGSPDVAATGYLCAASTLSELSHERLSRMLRRRAGKLNVESGTPANLVRGMFFRAVCDRRNANWRSAAREMENGIAMMHQVGAEDFELGFMFMQLCCCEFDKVSSEFEYPKLLVKHASDIDNERGLMWGYHGLALALARGGYLDEALQQVMNVDHLKELQSCHATEAICLGHLGYVLLQCSAHEHAIHVLEPCWNKIRERKLYNSLCLKALPLLICSLLGPDWLKAEIGNQKKRLRSLCRWCRITSAIVPNVRSMMERARGRSYWALGQKKQAIQCLERAVAFDREKEATNRLSLSLLDLAAVQATDRQRNRTEAIELLKSTESVIPRAESWLLGDQYDEEVVAPEFDIQDWERENGNVKVPRATSR